MFSRQVLVFGLIGWVYLVLAQPGQTRAESNLHIGFLEVHPALSLIERFEDNVCRTKNKECSLDGVLTGGRDSVAVVSPSLLFSLPIRNHRIEAEYRGEVARYHTLKTEDYEDNSVRGSFELDFPVGIQLMLNDLWTDGHEARQTVQNSEMDLFKKNLLKMNVRMEIGFKLSTELRYSNMTIVYDEVRNTFRNRMEGMFGGGLFYAFLPKTSLLIEFDQTQVKYDEQVEKFSRDNVINRILGGMTYQITEKSKGTVKVGNETKRFDAIGRKDYSGIVISMNIDHQFKRKTNLSLHMERGSRESTLAGSSTEKGQDYSLSSGGRLTIFHRFTAKISGDAGVGYWRDESAEKEAFNGKVSKRIDSTLGVDLGLDYWLQRWFSIGAGFGFERRSSTFNAFGFRSSVFSIGLGVAF